LQRAIFSNLTVAQFLLLVVILTGTYGFGLFDRLFSINTPVGVLTESLLILPLMTIRYLDGIGRRIDHKDALVLSFDLLLILAGVKVIQNVILDRVPLPLILTNLRPFVGLLLLYQIILHFRTTREVKLLLRYLVFISIVSAILALYQHCSGNIIQSRFSYYDPVFLGGEERFLTRNIWLLTLVLMLLITDLNKGTVIGRKYSIPIIGLLFVTILFTIIRSILGALFLSMLPYVAIKCLRRGQAWKELAGIAVIPLILLLVVGLLSWSGHDFGPTIDRFREGVYELTGSGEVYGTHSLRQDMLKTHFAAIMQECPFFGRGFDIVIREIQTRDDYLEPFARNEDATYGNVMIYFGLAGLTVLLIMLGSIIRAAYRLSRQAPNALAETYSQFALGIPIFFLVIGFYGDYFSYYGFILFSLFTGILYNLRSMSRVTASGRSVRGLLQACR